MISSSLAGLLTDRASVRSCVALFSTASYTDRPWVLMMVAMVSAAICCSGNVSFSRICWSRSMAVGVLAFLLSYFGKPQPPSGFVRWGVRCFFCN